MLEKKDRIVYLICKHFRNELTSEENIELEEWLSTNEKHRKLLMQFLDDDNMEENMKLFLNSEIPDAWTKLQQRLNAAQPVVRENRPSLIKRFWWAAAAIVLVTIGTSLFYILYKNKKKNITNATITQAQPKQDLVQPAYKAELTLVNGTKILLHNTKDGLINIQGAFQVYKHQDDIYYKENGAHVPVEKDLYNTLTTPPGGQYRLILSDQSIITMNVASYVKFNVSSSVRKVDFTGEAEFNITHNAQNPFLVMLPFAKSRGSTGKVEVTGTRFNINAYEDDAEKKITLLDGLINVSAIEPQSSELSTTSYFEKAQRLLTPGDQAQLQVDGRISITHQVDTAAVISWKNRLVIFNRTRTKNVLNTLEKWYDVKVIYNNDKVPECLFTGKITPETDIETVLEIMQFQCDDLHLKYTPEKKEILFYHK